VWSGKNARAWEWTARPLLRDALDTPYSVSFSPRHGQRDGSVLVDARAWARRLCDDRVRHDGNSGRRGSAADVGHGRILCCGDREDKLSAPVNGFPGPQKRDPSTSLRTGSGAPVKRSELFRAELQRLVIAAEQGAERFDGQFMIFALSEAGDCYCADDSGGLNVERE